jgi:hypothetical protein
LDEHAEQRSTEEEPYNDSVDDVRERTLTQRELVRASLLRCPPQEPADSPRS